MTKLERKKRDVRERLSQLLGVWGNVSKVARILGKHRTTVSTWVSDKRVSLPDVAEAGMICEALGVSLEQLFYGFTAEIQGRELSKEMQELMILLMQSKPETISVVRTILEAATYRDAQQNHSDDLPNGEG